MAQLRIAAVAMCSVPGGKADNLAKIEQWSERAAAEGAQLICFPAAAVTGFWESSAVAREAEILKVDAANPALIHPAGPSVERLERLSHRFGCHIAAGIIEDLDYYHLRNAVALFGPAGHIGTAAQVHTATGRHPLHTAAREYPVFDVNDVGVGFLVGDDVWYPEVARALVVSGARLLVAAMATPVEEEHGVIRAWRKRMASVLAARAMENDVPVVAVEAAGSVHNREEKTSYRFVGQAMAFAADGELVEQTPAASRDQMIVAELTVPNEAPGHLERRRPDLYEALTALPTQQDVPGTREKDWDAQGALLWSRIRDLGFMGVDLYARRDPAWTRRSEAVVVTAPSLPPLAGYRVVVLTRPCLARTGGDEFATLNRWVAAGGTLVLDGYCGRESAVLGPLAGVPGPMRREVHIPSYVDASRMTVRMRPNGPGAVFQGMDTRHHPKVWGQVWFPVEGAAITAEPLASIDSAEGQQLGAALYRHKVGSGSVFTFTYSTAYSQLLLMQGRGTTEDLGSFPERVAPGVPRDGDVNMWGDQVVTDSEDQFFPSADYHLLPVLNILRAAVPGHILVSPVPDGKAFGVIFTGDSDRADAGLVNQYTRHLASHGIRPTQFICREGYDARELDPDCEYGVHPLFHETEQQAFDLLIQYGFDPARIVCGRRHCLIQYGLTETLERMAACGIRYTSNNWDFPYPETQSAAFLFGTTLPHHIYNWAGRRIGIVDIPQVFMDYQPIMTCSQAAYSDTKRTHGVGAWNFHPQNQVIPEQVEAIEWLARQALRDGGWCGTMGAYGDFYLQRDQVEVAVRGEDVVIDGPAPAGLTLLSPRREIHINGTRCIGEQEWEWYGQRYWVLPVPAAGTSPASRPSRSKKG